MQSIHKSIFFLTLIFFSLFHFIPTHTAHAQSIDSISALLKKLETSIPNSFNQSTLASVYWTSPSPNTYMSLGIASALYSSNMYRLLTTYEPVGDVLAEETLGASALLQYRIKQWQHPFDVGMHALPLYISSDVMFLNFGGDIRYHILYDTIPIDFSAKTIRSFLSSLQPALVLGLIYNYSFLHFAYTLDGVEFAGIDKADSDVRIKINDITLSMDSHLHSIATRVEAQKQWSFVQGVLGMEPSIYISKLNTNTDALVQISRDSGESYSDYTMFSSITKEFLEAKGLQYEHFLGGAQMRIYTGLNAIFPITSKTKNTIGMQLGLELFSLTPSIGFGISSQW